MTTLDDDERLRQIERMIERGDVFGKPTKSKTKKVKAQEPKARKPRETYDHITDDMIMAVFEHTKTWAQMERELKMERSALRKRVLAIGIRKTPLNTVIRVQLPTAQEFIALATPERAWWEIAKMYGVSIQALRDYAKRIGFVKQRKPSRQKKTT